MVKSKSKRQEKLILFFLVLSLFFGCGILVGEGDMGVAPGEAGQEEPEASKINMNTADYYELISLPGIGSETAKKIIDFRIANGGCNSLEEMVVLDLISEETAAKIRDEVVVEFP